MMYACPNQKFVAHTYLLELQHLQNKVSFMTGNFPRHMPIGTLHVT